MDLYWFRFTFITSLLMHWDNIIGADMVKEWREKNKKAADKVRGDDRWPPWTWKTYLYHANGVVVIPGEVLASMAVVGGTSISVGRGSLKKQAASELMWEMDYPLLVSGKPIKMSDIDKIDGNALKQEKSAKKLGFVLHTRRVQIGASKHVRVRPQFLPGCCIEGELTVRNPNIIDEDTLRNILDACGQIAGIGDWRPGSKKPGKHGMFTVELKKIRSSSQSTTTKKKTTKKKTTKKKTVRRRK